MNWQVTDSVDSGPNFLHMLICDKVHIALRGMT